MMLCNHEEIAVQIAHGYAKATGKPMAVILHNLVGLLHACMAIYYAYPRPRADLHHGRDRPDGRRQAPSAHRLDPHRAGAGQRGARLHQVGLPADLDRRRAGKLRARLFDHDDRAERPDLHVLRRGAAGSAEDPRRCRCRRQARSRRRRRWRPIRARSKRSPTSCSRPSIRCCCRNTPAGARAASRASSSWPRLTGSAVWDVNNALNFPNKHPLCLSMDKQSLKHTDLIVGLDVKDWEKQLVELNNAKRICEPLPPKHCDYVEIGFAELGISKWAMDYCRMQPCSVRALGDTAIGIPELTRLCKETHREATPTLQNKIADAQGRDRQAPRSGVGEVAGGVAQGLGRLADHLLAARDGGLGRHQGRGLGAHRQRAQASGPQAVGLRQAVPPSRRRARHLDADRHLARRRAGAPRQEAASWSTSSPTAT